MLCEMFLPLVLNPSVDIFIIAIFFLLCARLTDWPLCVVIVLIAITSVF